METLDWDKYISFKEIYPGCKTTHFENLSKHSRIPYNEMLFFDDEDRNIKDITAIGVVCVLVDDRGVTRKTVREGLLKFEKERSGAKEVQSKWCSNLIRSNKPKAVQQIPCSSLNFYVIYFVCFKSISTFKALMSLSYPSQICYHSIYRVALKFWLFKTYDANTENTKTVPNCNHTTIFELEIWLNNSKTPPASPYFSALCLLV